MRKKIFALGLALVMVFANMTGFALVANGNVGDMATVTVTGAELAVDETTVSLDVLIGGSSGFDPATQIDAFNINFSFDPDVLQPAADTSWFTVEAAGMSVLVNAAGNGTLSLVGGSDDVFQSSVGFSAEFRLVTLNFTVVDSVAANLALTGAGSLVQVTSADFIYVHDVAENARLAITTDRDAAVVLHEDNEFGVVGLVNVVDGVVRRDMSPAVVFVEDAVGTAGESVVVEVRFDTDWDNIMAFSFNVAGDSRLTFDHEATADKLRDARDGWWVEAAADGLVTIELPPGAELSSGFSPFSNVRGEHELLDLVFGISGTEAGAGTVSLTNFALVRDDAVEIPINMVASDFVGEVVIEDAPAPPSVPADVVITGAPAGGQVPRGSRTLDFELLDEDGELMDVDPEWTVVWSVDFAVEGISFPDPAVGTFTVGEDVADLTTFTVRVTVSGGEGAWAFSEYGTVTLTVNVDMAVVSVGNATGGVGETVWIPVSITTNPGIVGYAIEVAFNEDHLDFAEVRAPVTGGIGINPLVEGEEAGSVAVGVAADAMANVNTPGVLFEIGFVVSAPVRTLQNGTAVTIVAEESSLAHLVNGDPEDFLGAVEWLAGTVYPARVADDFVITASPAPTATVSPGRTVTFNHTATATDQFGDDIALPTHTINWVAGTNVPSATPAPITGVSMAGAGDNVLTVADTVAADTEITVIAQLLVNNNVVVTSAPTTVTVQPAAGSNVVFNVASSGNDLKQTTAALTAGTVEVATVTIGGGASRGITLPNVPAGTYTLTVTMDGHLSVTINGFTVSATGEVNWTDGDRIAIPAGTNPAVITLVVGDLDGNGTVNPADLGDLLAVWGASGINSDSDVAQIVADLDGNATVNPADLGDLLANWGSNAIVVTWTTS